MHKMMEATQPLVYATRRLMPGDSFRADSPEDANVLVALGKAKIVGEIPPEIPADIAQKLNDRLTAKAIEAPVEPYVEPLPADPAPAPEPAGSPVGAMTTENSGLADPPPVNPPLEDVADSGDDSDDAETELAALRAEYREAFGKQPYHGWDAATLRDKMAG